jgi:ABC-type multidrug transport system fused ATPase/permease subunit
MRYGNLTATHEAIAEAAKKVSLHEQILRMPDGYKTLAREPSGGQQQCIAIARLFLKIRLSSF